MPGAYTSDMENLLRMEHVRKSYDGTQALQDVSLSVQAGEVHALMGENGAGKSTLGKIIAGAVLPDSAEIYWQGRRVDLKTPIEAQKLGIGIVFQELDIFPNLSVAENIVIGNLQVERRQYVNWRELISFCAPFLERVGLTVDPKIRAGDLRMGEMQLVSIARALSFNARLIVMDEPTSSLTGDAVDRLHSLIRQLKSAGVSIVYVSHKMEEILRISDRVSILRDGRNVGTCRTEETTIDQIISMMVGRELSTRAPRQAIAAGKVTLRAEHLSTSNIRDISFELKSGEVLGVAGLVGSGRSELGAALFGLDRITSGTIVLKDHPFRPRSARDAIRQGLCLLPEDRKLAGLMMRMSVRQNTTMASLDRFQTAGYIHAGQELNAARPIHRRIRLRAASDTIDVETLSGGNQQKVLFAKWLLADPDVLFLDDPTRGVDIGAKQDIYDLIAQLALEGKSIIFVSSELPELLLNCDRILVMNERSCAGILDGSTATQEQIMALAVTPGALKA